MTPIHSIPSFSNSQFIDRYEEIKVVEELVSQKQNGSQVVTQALAVRCERGSGKTWFSLYLKRSVFLKNKNVDSLLICLSPPAGVTEIHPTEWISKESAFTEEQLSELVLWVASALGANWAQNPSLHEVQTWIANRVKHMEPDKLLVVILDSLYDTDQTLQKKLEEDLLAPLLETRKVLLILTGRGTPGNFMYEALGPNAKLLELKPFPRNYAQEQIKKIRKALTVYGKLYSLDEILEIANGYPIVIALLTQGDDLEIVVDELLSPLVDGPQRKMLEALCPLNRFGEAEILPMLIAGGIASENWTLNDIRNKVRDPLIQSSLMKKQGGHFYLDENVRHVLCQYLDRKHPSRWRELNRVVYDMYMKWVAEPKFRAHKEYFEEKAAFHKKIVESDLD